MGFIISIIFIALFFSLILSQVREGRAAKFSQLFRVLTIVASISVFVYWFIERSSVHVVKDSVSLQVINKLPQPLDFYVIKIDTLAGKIKLETQHIGKIRPEHYRLEYLKMQNSDEYWVAGYLGKKNMVYFSQHSVPNKNIDQVLEVNNYINQSEKLSGKAKKQIDVYNFENIKFGIWVTLNLLLLFINIILFFRKK